MQSDLIDRIYECSVAPELWPTLLDDLADISEARGGLMFSANKSLAWTASDTIRDVFDDYVKDGWFGRCSRRMCLMQQKMPAFFVEHDFWDDEALKREPIYRDFFVPRGLGWSAGTGLIIPTGDNIVFSLEREFERGPFEKRYVEQLNGLRPHLARSALISSRMSLKRATGATEALTDLRLPALLLNEAGGVVEANELIVELKSLLSWGVSNRIRLSDPSANGMLAAALQAIKAGSDPAANSFVVRDGEGSPSLVAHVIPIKRSAHDIFGSSYALLMLTPVGSKRVPSITLLNSLFDLTPAEARIASGLAEGKTLEEIAELGGVAKSTVRKQLRGVFDKTGCSRQAEVAALLSNLALGADPAES
ncbi:MAG: helix-turn-helix transcriptional regulator [Phenylobacterium sp.]|uniref:helix-turn-helix transcriptional regulator n=1 Tax=Phenylobacterium sp. TaxID=1871053 RepID=UPI0025DD397C|nr:helix-turn-helix transcriptional regulator [Phenylobacterium sp.]MBI1200668.1 helix-turn-helix transcriptional regulator [Phenylobacterium sp.]